MQFMKRIGDGDVSVRNNEFVVKNDVVLGSSELTDNWADEFVTTTSSSVPFSQSVGWADEFDKLNQVENNAAFANYRSPVSIIFWVVGTVWSLCFMQTDWSYDV